MRQHAGQEHHDLHDRLGAGATGAPATLLQNCAKPNGAYYPAATAADLQAAFRAIAQSLNNLRLTK